MAHSCGGRESEELATIDMNSTVHTLVFSLANVFKCIFHCLQHIVLLDAEAMFAALRSGTFTPEGSMRTTAMRTVTRAGGDAAYEAPYFCANHQPRFEISYDFKLPEYCPIFMLVPVKYTRHTLEGWDPVGPSSSTQRLPTSTCTRIDLTPTFPFFHLRSLSKRVVEVRSNDLHRHPPCDIGKRLSLMPFPRCTSRQSWRAIWNVQRASQWLSVVRIGGCPSGADGKHALLR